MSQKVKHTPYFHASHTASGQSLRIIALGGAGTVTKNMFVYEYRTNGTIKDIVIVDCGIGFPEPDMYGIDLLLPDATYLHDKKQYIRGIVFTHGHDDHIGALPYVYPSVGPTQMFGTRLTAAFANLKLKERGIKESVQTVSFDDTLRLGSFTVSFVRMTHSVPDAASVVLETPVGIFYHASDFKFDVFPLDGKISDLHKINRFGGKGIRCLLTDCLGSERRGFTQSEKIIGETIKREMDMCHGKFLFTTQSSNISRIQLVVDIAREHNRRVVFVGRSIDQNTEAAGKLGYVRIPQSMRLSEKDARGEQDRHLCYVVAGSQGQPGSAMARIAHDNHAYVRLSSRDTVVFSADPIPGHELTVDRIIDQLFRKGVRVSYGDIMEDLHVSGHGSQGDLMLLLSALGPDYVWPIGGTFRHTMLYRQLASQLGYKNEGILLPQDGDIIEFTKNQPPKTVSTIDLNNIMVDGLGIGDVGKVVLRDRQTLAQDGIVVIVIPIDQSTGRVTAEPDIISRGFVFIKESGEIIDKAKEAARTSLKLKKGKIIDWRYVKERIIRNVERVLSEETGRYPLIVPIILEV